jgi:DNA-binding transcriptional MerR regulator
MKANSPLRNDGGSPHNLNDVTAGTVAGREMTIGEMARAYGVTLRTLRFYEDRNLLRPRRAGNARYYGGVDRARLAMILKGKQLGFTLSEIADLIGGDDGASRTDFEERLQPVQIVDQLDHLERQRREIDEAIAMLKATRERLAQHATPA